jgi:hypothetical protein
MLREMVFVVEVKWSWSNQEFRVADIRGRTSLHLEFPPIAGRSFSTSFLVMCEARRSRVRNEAPTQRSYHDSPRYNPGHLHAPTTALSVRHPLRVTWVCSTHASAATVETVPCRSPRMLLGYARKRSRIVMTRCQLCAGFRLPKDMRGVARHFKVWLPLSLP